VITLVCVQIPVYEKFATKLRKKQKKLKERLPRLDRRETGRRQKSITDRFPNLRLFCE
tara:strand:- start:56 stop:229 length:174 start_codon:yes stop_codon:yes gene_type:complete